MRALLLLVLLLIAPTVHAAPVLLIAAIVAQAYGYALVATALMVAASAYGSMEARRKAAAQAAAARRAYNANLSDRSVTVLRADPPLRVIYGDVVTGGDIVAVFSSDKQGTRSNGQAYTKPDAYKHLVIVLAAHEVAGIDTMYIDGVAVPVDGSGWATGTEFAGEARQVNRGAALLPGQSATFSAPVRVLSCTTQGGFMDRRAGSYSLSNGNKTITSTDTEAINVSLTYPANESWVRWSKHLGTPGDAADAYLRGVVPTKWASTDTLNGLAYVTVTLDLEHSRFQGGPPQLTWRVRGRKVLDARTGQTVYSTNPALVIRDVLTSPLWGLDVAAADTDTASVIAAANACDAPTAFHEGVGGFLGPLYTCNGCFTTDQAHDGVLDELATSMAGYVVHGAQWSVHAGVWSTPVLSLTDDDLHGQIEIVQAGSGFDEVVNGLRGQFVPEGSAVPSDYDAYQSAPALDADGRELWGNLNLPYTNGRARAKNLARIEVERSRDALVARYPAKLKAWPLQFMDRVAITSREYGWTAKTFRVTDWQFGLGTAVLLTLQEDGAVIWDQADAATAEQLPNTELPNPWIVAEPKDVDADSGDAWLQVNTDGSLNIRVAVSWAPITDGYVVTGGRVEVIYRSEVRDAPGTWEKTGATGSDVRAFITGAADGDVLTIGVRNVNGLGVASGWVYISHTVVGKRLPPSNVASLTFRTEPYGVRLMWPDVPDRDVVAYLIRIGGTSWETAGDAVRVSGTDYLLGIPAQSQFKAWIKALDSSGRESAAATNCDVNVGAPPSAIVDYAIDGPNEVLTWTFDPGIFFALDHYEIRMGANWASGALVTTTKATQWVHRVDYLGGRRYWVAAIDAAGNPSTPTSVDVAITAPGQPTSGRSEVVDNNALLYWSAPLTGTLPIERYEVRKGVSWAAGAVVGSNGNSTFTAIFEQQSGNYTYWVAAWDSAGNLGVALAIQATINQPPDYVLRTNIDSTFAGSKTNVYWEAGSLIGPRDTTESWATHFTARSWASPQDQINAGYPLYAQPGLASGSYTEDFDYGTVLPATTVTVTLGTQVVASGVTVTCQIYTKELAAGAWVAAPVGYSVLRDEFRYVRVVISLTCTAGTPLQRITSLNVKLSSKLRTDSGAFAVNDANAGVWVPFTVDFIDAETPIVQAAGMTPLIPVVDFTDTPNPTGFRIYLYTTAGARTTGAGSWTCRGF